MKTIIEGLAVLIENPVACSAVGSIQIFAAVAAVVVVAHAVFQVVTVRRLRAAWPVAPASERRLRRAFANAVRRAGLSKAPALRLTPDGTGPCTIGFWRPDVCVSRATVDELDDEELEAVLLHELAHVTRRDTMGATIMLFSSWTAVFLISAGSMLADRGSPESAHIGVTMSRLLMTTVIAVFIAIRFAVTVPGRFLRELTCDDMAVRASGNPLALAAGLIKVSRPRNRRDVVVSAGAFAAEDAFLIHRIRRLLNYEAPRLRLALQRAAFTALLLLFAASAFGVDALPLTDGRYGAAEERSR